MDAELRAQIARRERVIDALKRILIEDLHLALPADAIDLDAALFGAGLGLDSVDALGVAAVEARFRVTFPHGALRGSLRSLNAVVDRVLDLASSEAAA